MSHIEIPAFPSTLIDCIFCYNNLARVAKERPEGPKRNSGLFCSVSRYLCGD